MIQIETSRSIRYKAVAIITLAVVFSILLVWYGNAVLSRMGKTQGVWEKFNTHAVVVNRSLLDIEKGFGYGGFIHHFKNLVIRRDLSLVPLIEEDLKDTYKAIDELSEMEPSGDLQADIQQLRGVVDHYVSNFAVAQAMITDNKTTEEIDTLVKVDNQPALQAINTISEHIRSHSNEIFQETAQQIMGTRDLVVRGLLLIPLVFIIAVTLTMFLKRLLQTNQNLEIARKYSDDLMQAVPDALFMIDEQGNFRNSNLMAQKILGYSKEELGQMKVEDLIPAHFRHAHIGMRNAAVNGYISRPMEKSMKLVALHKDGHEIPVEIGISFSMQEDGVISIASMRDITERVQSESQLKRSEEMMSKAQEIAHLGNWDWNLEQNSFNWSNEIYHMFGQNLQQCCASYDQFMDHIHEQDREAVRQAMLDAVSTDAPFRIEHRVVRETGEVRYVQEEGTVIRNDYGDAIQMIGTVLDVTERRKTEEGMRLAQTVFDNSMEAILVLDFHGNIVDLNDAFSALIGYERDELLHTAPTMFSLDRHKTDFYTNVWPVITIRDFWQGELWSRHKSGTLSPCLASISKVKDSAGQATHYVCIYLDISSIKESQQQLEKMAHYDQLTGLVNRLVFNDRLLSAISRAHRNQSSLAVLFIDLDGFKQVNDHLGHEAGDELLIEAANAIKHCVREDDSVGRLGGDEFALILYEQSALNNIELVVNRILKALNKQLDDGAGGRLQVSASIGISLYPVDHTDPEGLIRSADHAMYQAKKAGKNRFCYFSSDIYDKTDLSVQS